MRLRRYRKKKLGNYISICLLVVPCSLFISLKIINYFDKKVNEILLPKAESQVRKIIAMIINSACDELIINDNLYIVNKNMHDEIQLISYNSFEATKLINEITLKIENKLMDFETGKMNYYGNKERFVTEIPMGMIFGNSLLNNVGPKIKVKMDILGDVLSNIETEVKPYGMNNAYIEMRIKLDVTARIVMPFVTEKIIITQIVPLSMDVVQGTVPEAYISSYK